MRMPSFSLSRRRVLAGLSSLAILPLAAPHIARAAARVARFGHGSPDQSPFGLGGTAFAAAVAADPVLSGTLKIEIYGAGQLGDDMTILHGCTKSTIDGGIIASSIIANIVTDLGILNAPYLFRNVTQARAVLDGTLGDDFLAAAQGKGLPVLAWGENGLRHITSNKPVHAAADLHALRLRVPQSEILLAGFRALGANAAPLSFVLLREALRTGEFEAQENAIVTIEASKLYEVQKYLCLTGHAYDAIGFIASADLLEDLDEPQRAALTRCARKAALATREASDAAVQDGVARLKAAGMTVIDDVDIASLRAAARPFLESLSSIYGAARVRSLLAAGG